MASESDSATSEEEPVMKKSKSQLQTDLRILMMENKRLKEEVAHCRGKATNLYFKTIKFYTFNVVLYIFIIIFYYL